MKITRIPLQAHECWLAVEQHRATFFDCRDALSELLESAQHNYLNVAVEFMGISKVVRDYFAEEEVLIFLTIGDECVPVVKEHIEEHRHLIRILDSLHDMYLAGGHSHYLMVARQIYLWIRDVEAHIHELDTCVMDKVQYLKLEAA